MIDDVSYNDMFLKKLLTLVAPKGCPVEVLNAEKSGLEFQNENLEKAPAMIVIKDIKTAYDSYKYGFHFDKLQVGGAIKVKPEDVNIFKTVYISKEDAAMLNFLENNGVEIEFRCQLYDDKTSWKDLRTKFFQRY